MATLTVCPDCGAALQLIADGIVGKPRLQGVGTFAQSRPIVEPVLVLQRFVACTGCEFCEAT